MAAFKDRVNLNKNPRGAHVPAGFYVLAILPKFCYNINTSKSIEDFFMLDGKNIKSGDKIIEFGHVFQISEIKERVNGEETTEKVICYKPVYINNKNETLIQSIPVKNLNQTSIRRPLDKTNLKELIGRLSEKIKLGEDGIDVGDIKDVLKLNDPKQTINALRQLWADKHDEETNFTKSKRDALDMAMRRFIEEVALVYDISLEKARSKVERALKKAFKN